MLFEALLFMILHFLSVEVQNHLREVSPGTIPMPPHASTTAPSVHAFSSNACQITVFLVLPHSISVFVCNSQFYLSLSGFDFTVTAFNFHHMLPVLNDASNTRDLQKWRVVSNFTTHIHMFMVSICLIFLGCGRAWNEFTVSRLVPTERGNEETCIW